MALPVVQSFNTASSLASNTVTITKPTGLAVGDLLVAKIANYDATGSNITHTTPSGWTVIQKEGTAGQDCRAVAYWRIAEASDVSASNFSFVMSGSVTSMTGVLTRVTNFVSSNPVSVSELDSAETASGTTRTYTTSLTPASFNSLLFVMFANGTTNMTGGPATTTAYTTTPSTTLTELADVGTKNVSDDGNILGVATVQYEGYTEITSRGCTISETMTQDNSSIIFFVNGTYDQTGTHALLEPSTTFFGQAGRGDTNGNSALLEVSPTLHTQSGNVTTRTQWQNESKPSTTWTNETL